jgi:Fibronectin type III domain/FG-GAP-like repeat
MENALALGGCRIAPPQIYARQPGLARLNRRMVCLGWILILVLGLLAQAQPASGVTLFWDPSSGSNIAGYRLHFGTASGRYIQIVDVGNVTSFTVNGLLHGTTYYFVVTAYDATGLESPASNQVAFTARLKGTLGVANKDFNDDGFDDLVWENSSTGERLVWTMHLGASVSSINLGRIDPSWHIAGVGDFLGDGESDLVWERSNGQHLIWIMQLGVPVYSITLPTLGGGWHVVGAGDFNGDGKADLVWENSVTGAREIWLMNNGSPTSAIILPTVGTDWHIAGVGDFLGNGQADLVWENTANGGREIWLMNNGVPTSAIILPKVGTDWHIAGTGRFMVTGQADLVFENTLNGQHLIWVMNNGQPTSTIGLPTLPTDWHLVNH